MSVENLETDVLIIGGGTAGCYAAIKLGSQKDISVLVAEKANIQRSGCLAAGVNALNAYITEGHTPQDYVDYASNDAEGIVRNDLLLSICKRLNGVTEDLEKRGLVILKDENGKYVSRGWRNIKINGENIKPLLAEGAKAQKNVQILNHINITDLETEEDESGKKRVTGAFGFSVNEKIFYHIKAKAVLVATGGAAVLSELYGFAEADGEVFRNAARSRLQAGIVLRLSKLYSVGLLKTCSMALPPRLRRTCSAYAAKKQLRCKRFPPAGSAVSTSPDSRFPPTGFAVSILPEWWFLAARVFTFCREYRYLVG